MTEQEMREVFREMREEPVPADSLARVRAAVDARTHRRRWVSPWQIAATVLVAAACAVGVVMFRPAVPAPEAPFAGTLVPAAVPESPVQPPVALTPARPKRARPRPRPAEIVPVSIRIETPDPEVVILLVN
ncbi:MAG: hypothetical protein LAO55_12340 [Acidobacteriia bacterium]|nr:hypothetical protein [Terriglobia bacterium]